MSLLRLLPLAEAWERMAAAAATAGAERVALGVSREQRPIELVRFGSGAQRVLWYAGPHANEPIGVTSIVALAERFAAQPELLDGPLGHDLVLNVDPDGHVRNEGWFADPFDLEAYYRGFFRPTMAECPDWDLPLEHRSPQGTLTREPSLPEGRALLQALEISQPIAVVALHNAEIGGLHFYVTGPDGTVPRFARLLDTYDLPVERLPVDDPAASPLAPGVFEMPNLDAVCEQLLASGHPEPSSLLPFGDLAGNWAHKHFGTTSVIAEIPLWSVAAPPATEAQDERELALETAAALHQRSEELATLLAENADWFAETNPMARATQDGLVVLTRLAAGLQAWAGAEASRRPVTEDALGRYKVFLELGLPQRYLGMALQTALAADLPEAALQRFQHLFDEGMRRLLALGVTAHPLDLLVDIQITAGLELIAATTGSEEVLSLRPVPART